MAGYKLQGKNSTGDMLDIPLAATYDIDGNPINTTYAKQNGSYPSMTVGKATSANSATTANNAANLGGTPAAQYAKTNGNYQEMVVGQATIAGNATQLGGSAANTYAKTSGTYANMTVGNATKASSAGSADKLTTARKLTIGSTGKDFDGSAAVSWSLSEIGAAAASHSHPLSGISDLHASWDAVLKAAPTAYVTRWPTISEVTNKQNLVVKLNGGTTEGTNLFTYNATAAKSINITPSNIGAAPASHSHSYLPLSGGTLTGNLTLGSSSSSKQLNVYGTTTLTGNVDVAYTLEVGTAVQTPTIKPSANYSITVPSKSGTMALTSDIPTNYVTTNTAQNITAKKTFTVEQNFSSINLTSDRRLKKNIKPYETDKSILDVDVKEFEWIDEKAGRGKQIGIIAQDLQEYFPELVVTGEDGYLRIKETKLVYLLMQEVKRLRDEVNGLKEGK